MSQDRVDLDELGDLLDRFAGGETTTQHVSVALPVPLAEAVGLLVDAGLLASTSAAASAGLERVVRNLALRAQLDELYGKHPDLRPDEAEVAAVLERNRHVQREGAA